MRRQIVRGLAAPFVAATATVVGAAPSRVRHAAAATLLVIGALVLPSNTSSAVVPNDAWQGTLNVSNLTALSGLPAGTVTGTLTLLPVSETPTNGVYPAGLDYAWSYNTFATYQNGSQICTTTISHTGAGTNVNATVTLQPGAAPQTPDQNYWLIDFRPAASTSLQEYLQITQDTCGGPTDPAPMPSGGLAFTEAHRFGPPSDGTETRISGVLPDFDDLHLYQVTANLSRGQNTPPDTTITGGPTATTNDSTPTFTFVSSETASTFACRIDGAPFAACTTPFTTAALADGAHTFEVRATDGASNIDPTPATRSFIVDTVAPQTTITGGPTATTNDSTPTFTFVSSETASTFACRIDAAAFAACTTPFTTAALADGAHTFEVRATDRAGNIDPTPATGTFTVSTVAPPPPPPPPPVVPTCQGKEATIVGTAGHDEIQGTAGNDVIVGLGGDDDVEAGADNDLVCAGAGNDRVAGAGGKDAILGEAGKDRLGGGGGDDELVGGDADDRLRGNGGDDRLLGKGGDDHLDGGLGRDRCQGGPGRDVVVRCEP